MTRLAELGCELLNAMAIQVWAWNGGDLRLAAAFGEPRLDALPAAEILERQALDRREMVVLQSPARSQRAWVMPLLGSSEMLEEDAPGDAPGREFQRETQAPVLGVFSVYGPAAEAGLLDWDHKVLACLANYAVLALQNAAHQDALKNAQEQRAVAETFAAVGDIAANLLHQLNNKIGTIPVRVQGIQDKCDDLVSNDRYLAANLAEIERSASDAMAAVRENLAQLRPIQMAEISVLDCVREALAEARLPGEITGEPAKSGVPARRAGRADQPGLGICQPVPECQRGAGRRR